MTQSEMVRPIFIGRWTPKILFSPRERPYRHGHLRRRLASISQRMLTGSAILGASNCLRLAAAPTFAVMALLSGLVGSQQDLLCSAAHDVSPLSGMAAMYLLMSIFHSPAWLQLISSRRKGGPRGRSCA